MKATHPTTTKKSSRGTGPNRPAFPRIQFADDVNMADSLRLDPMLRGVDMEALRPVTEKIHTLQERLLLPEGYDVHNPFQLLPERVYDTTDRSTVMWAAKDHFDKEGFEQGKPLAKDIYYTDPYVTCHWCNAINFVDVIAVRRMISLPAELQDQVDVEPIPFCQCCKRTNFFEIGPKIFPNVVEEREQVVAKALSEELVAAVAIKRAYRSYLRRMYGRAFRATVRAHNLLRHRAATCITKNARVRLARRQLKTERFLLIIKEAHPILLKKAILPTAKSAKKLFWYESKEHERMLYADYIDFMDRTGFEPPRCVVEDNIAEIATRIRIRENMLTTRVQKRWRGFLSRRMIGLYRSECLWLRQLKEARVLRIQRLYRAHNARLKIIKRIYAAIAAREHEKYKHWREEKRITSERSLAKHLALSAYIKERAVEKTTRVTGRIEFGRNKMMAFSQSCYADDRLVVASSQVAANEITRMQLEKKHRDDRRERREFLMARIAEHGPKGYGKRGFAPEMDSLYSASAMSALESIANTASLPSQSSNLANDQSVHGVDYIRESSRSRGMRAAFNDELRVLTDQVVQDSVHDAVVTPKELAKQFRVHNSKTDLPNLKHYKFPKDINLDKMAVLYEEIPRLKTKK